MINTYFAGAGVIYLAKFDKDGKRMPFVDVGNVPYFSFSRTVPNQLNSEPTARIIFENFNETTFDLIFGGFAEETTVDTFSDVGEFKQKYKDSKILVTPIVDYNKYRQCSIVFEGFNIANSDKESIRFELNSVSLRPAKTFEAIGDNIAQFECLGHYTPHADDKAFYLVDGKASMNVIPVRAKPPHVLHKQKKDKKK